MKVAVVYNKKNVDSDDVINVFGMSTKEHYSEIAVERVAKALESGGHSVKIVEGGMGFIDELKNFMPRVVSGERPGIVFNMAYKDKIGILMFQQCLKCLEFHMLGLDLKHILLYKIK